MERWDSWCFFFFFYQSGLQALCTKGPKHLPEQLPTLHPHTWNTLPGSPYSLIRKKILAFNRFSGFLWKRCIHPTRCIEKNEVTKLRTNAMTEHKVCFLGRVKHVTVQGSPEDIVGLQVGLRRQEDFSLLLIQEETTET